jgi:signal transduction histidine kinase
MIQELFHNTLKHANASQIDLTLKISDKFLYLNYFDNGIGLKQSTPSKPGIGMANLKSRTDFLGGKLEINHEAKQGFEITFSFKLKKIHGRK